MNIFKAIECMGRGYYARAEHWADDCAVTIRDGHFVDTHGCRKLLAFKTIMAEWVVLIDELPRCPECGGICRILNGSDSDEDFFWVACLAAECGYTTVAMPTEKAATVLHIGMCEKIKELRADHEKGE